MHATRHNPTDDSDLEDIVVYADEDYRIGRAAQVPKLVPFNGSPECWHQSMTQVGYTQAQQEEQNVRLHPGRNYVHLQQQLQSTRSATLVC